MSVKIHQVEVFHEKHHTLDPIRGMVLKTEDVIRRGSASRISHELGEFDIEPDGSFIVPDEVAEFLCNTPGWFEGPNPFVEEIAAENASTPKPSRRKAKAPAAA